MASLFSMGAHSMPDDDIDGLGIPETIGLTDNLFSSLGRAPVDELWAGRNSAAINDIDFMKREKKARDILLRERSDLGPLAPSGPYWEQDQNSDFDTSVRDRIAQEAGLHVYPGQVTGKTSAPYDQITVMQEFSDRGASLKDGWRDLKAVMHLRDVLDHDELYKHYPEIASLPLTLKDLGDPRQRGVYYPPSAADAGSIGSMEVNSARSDEDTLNTIIHEAQHYIQSIEGWPRGGNMSAPTTRNFGIMQPQHSRNLPEQVIGQEAYRNIDGEILARDAASRLRMPDDVRSKEGPDGLLYEQLYPVSKRSIEHGNAHPHSMPMSEADKAGSASHLHQALKNRSWTDDDPFATTHAIDAAKRLKEFHIRKALGGGK